MNKIKLGIIGCGFICQSVHIPNFKKARNCDIIALSDTRTKVGNLVAKKSDIPKFYSSIRELIKDSDIEAVVMIVPYQLNHSLAIEIIQSGKHLFLEKPLTLCTNDALEMCKLAEKKGVKLMVGYHKRYDPGCELGRAIFKKTCESGEMGNVTFARIHNFTGNWKCGFDPFIVTDSQEQTLPYEKIVPLNVPDFIEVKDKEVYFGTVGNYCHDINLMRFFLGDPQGILFSTFKEGMNIYTARTVTDFDYGDFEAIFETGGMDCDFWDEEIKIYFEKGWIEIKVAPPLLRNMPSTVTIYRDGKGFEQPEPQWEWAFEREAQHFVNCVFEDLKVNSSGYDSYKDLEVFEAMYKSRKGKKTVPIHYSI